MTSLRRRAAGAILRGLTRAPVRLPEERLLGRLFRLLDPDGAAVIDRTGDATLVTFRRRAVLFYALRDTLARGVPGGIAEIGVHRGGTAGLLAAVLLDAGLERHLHLYDAWGALPSPTEADGRQAESYRHENIPDKLADLVEDPPRPVAEHTVHTVVGYPREATTYHQGWYEETLRPEGAGALAFVHIDCDYYDSVRLALAFFAETAAPGAVAVCDDYGTWDGATQAIREFAVERRGLIDFTPLASGQALLARR